MAEKRAKDRAILDIVGLAKDGFYSVVDMTVEEWENAGYVNPNSDKDEEKDEIIPDDPYNVALPDAPWRNPDSGNTPMNHETVQRCYIALINQGHTRKEIDQVVIELRGDMKLSDKAKARYVDYFNPNIPEEEMLRQSDVPDTVAEAIEKEYELSTAVPGLEGGWTNWKKYELQILVDSFKNKEDSNKK